MELQKILITGTNRGLGKQLAKLLIQKRPDLHIYLTLRSNTSQLAQKQWRQQFPDQQLNITCLSLDLMNDQSINNFFKILEQNKWVFRYLVNNAAVGADLGGTIPSPELAQKTFHCNTIKTIQFTKRMLKYLGENARIINVSSGLGGLKYQPQEKQKLLNNPQTSTQQHIINYIKEYIQQCEIKKLSWFDSCYGTSKLFLNSWSRFILQEKLLKQGQICMCMSPGPCATDMGPPKPQFTPQQGAGFIYDCISRKDAKKGIFYHTGNQRGFQWCGIPKN